MTATPTVLAVVQAGGQGSRMDVLTRERAKPTLPFAGSYQLVDFPLSNLTHSLITDVWLSVQFQAGSLYRHLAAGRPWDLDRTRGGLRWLMPEDQVWTADLRPVVAAHLGRGSGCTVLTTEVGRTQATQKDVVTVGGGSRVTKVEHKPEDPSGTTIAAEVFVFEPEVLCRTLDDLRRERSHTEEGNTGIGDFGEHLLPRLVRDGSVHAWPLEGYWADLGTPALFLTAHRDLLAGRVDAVGRPDWPILTRWPELPAARVDAGAVLEDSSSALDAGWPARCDAACWGRASSWAPAPSSRTRCCSHRSASVATRTSPRRCSTRTPRWAPVRGSGSWRHNSRLRTTRSPSSAGTRWWARGRRRCRRPPGAGQHRLKPSGTA